VGGLLADDESSAVVATVEPFRGRYGTAASAIKTHSCAQFDEWAALGKLGRVSVFDPHQRRALIVSEYADGTDGDLVPGFGLSDGLPFSGGTNECHYQDGREDYREDEEGFFQCKFPKHQFAAILWGMRAFLSIGFADRCLAWRRGIVYASEMKWAAIVRHGDRENGSPSFHNV
jgi:hypothetical protein